MVIGEVERVRHRVELFGRVGCPSSGSFCGYYDNKIREGHHIRLKYESTTIFL